MDFRTPLFLILLAVIPVLIFVQRRRHLGTTKWRKSVTFFLRGAALLCTILALASLHRTHKEQRLAVVFLIDTSESVPRAQHEAAIRHINAAVAKLRPTDQFGIISFARETSVLTGIRQKQDQRLESISTGLLESLAEQTIRRDGTDILTALKRAITVLPNDAHRRIVLLSDGVHNAGGTRLEAYLPLLSASDVEIATIPLDTLKDAVRVVQLQAPTEVRKGQRFEMNTVIETDGSLPKVPAILYHEGALIGTFEWTLPSGRHSLSLPVPPVSEEGNHRYELKLEGVDEILENNQGYAVVKVQENRPRILYVEEDDTQTVYLKTVLEENGFDVEVTTPAEMPTDLTELQRSDVLILSNVSADILSPEHLQSIENYVRDLGHGLVVIGGEHAYGPGGYTHTPLESVLPVKMTPRERKDTVAIVFVLDTSGSMANYVGGQRRKIDLAIAGISAGISNLEEDDEAGVISFSAGRDAHVSELTSNRDTLLQTIRKLRPTGGTTLMKEAIEDAGEMLKANDAKRKHILLLSDGKSDDTKSDFVDLAKQLAEAHISITAIAIGDANEELLMQLTESSNGHFVPVQNLQELPMVLTEAVRETQRYIVQEPFQPVITAPSEPIVDGIGIPPKLHGYIATMEKDTARVFIRSHKDEPVLAGWNIGLGKAVAWTSDAKPAWAKEWIPWHNFGKFWGQIVNWVLPAADADFDLVVSLRRGAAEVSIDTQIPSQAAYEVRVAGPSGTSEPIEMQQRTLTRHNGTFQIHDSGSYIVTAQREGDGHKRTEVLSLPYPVEYAEFEVNIDLLKTLASETAGIYEPTPTQIASPAGTPIEKQVSLAHALLIAAALLFVLEMILRRYSIANRRIAEFFGQLRGQSTGVQVDTAPSTERVTRDAGSVQSTEASMTRLLAAKRRVR